MIEFHVTDGIVDPADSGRVARVRGSRGSNCELSLRKDADQIVMYRTHVTYQTARFTFSRGGKSRQWIHRRPTWRRLTRFLRPGAGWLISFSVTIKTSMCCRTKVWRGLSTAISPGRASRTRAWDDTDAVTGLSAHVRRRLGDFERDSSVSMRDTLRLGGVFVGTAIALVGTFLGRKGHGLALISIGHLISGFVFETIDSSCESSDCRYRPWLVSGIHSSVSSSLTLLLEDVSWELVGETALRIALPLASDGGAVWSSEFTTTENPSSSTSPKLAADPGEGLSAVS